MKLVKISLAISILSLLSACATTVKPTYVSPTHYQTLNCQQLQGNTTVFSNILIMVLSRLNVQVSA